MQADESLMHLLHDPIRTLWILWLIFWAVAALWVKRTRRREPLLSLLAHAVPLTVAAWLLLMSHPGRVLGLHLIPESEAGFLLGLALVALGLAFAVWARVHLGRNWSGTVTLKQEHELIRNGPYRYVRHPIYTGLLAAFLGTAIAIGELRGLLAFVLVWLSLWRKWRLEERWMQETFGDAYTQYRAEVPAVIPGLHPQIGERVGPL